MTRPEDVASELVETACRARWDAQGSTFTGYNGDVAHTWDALATLFPAQAENHRAVERHALAAVLPECAVAWDQGYTWGHNDSQNETETKNPYRAARLTATTEEPTT